MKDEGDDDAFARWYAEAAGPATRRVAAAVGDGLLAREATAEAFARAYERWSRVRRMDAPKAWVHTVAVNLCRRSWRRRELEARALARLGAVTPEAVGPVEAASDDLRQAVESLPARMRTAVELRYWSDLSEVEIARRMEVAPGTVAAMLHQARRRLGERAAAERAVHDA